MPSAKQVETKKRILVVDDVRDAADVYAALLSRWGYETRAVYDGPTCLARASEFRPHMILLDVGLPSMTGYEVVERLRRDPSTAAIKVFAISGYSNPEHIARCRQAGFDDCFVKPVANEWLKEFLASVASTIAEQQ